MKTVIPGLTPDEVRRLRFPRKKREPVERETDAQREARLGEITKLISEGYSRMSSIKQELKKEHTDRVIRRDLQELRTRGAIRCVRTIYWIPK